MCNRGLHVNTGNDVDTMLITTNIVAYIIAECNENIVERTHFHQQKDHELRLHSSKSRMNARLTAVMATVFKFSYAPLLFSWEETIYCKRGCVTITRYLHIRKKKFFSFRNGIRNTRECWWLICPENGNFVSHARVSLLRDFAKSVGLGDCRNISDNS